MNQVVRTWVNAMAEATAPDRVVWFGGSDEEAQAIEASMVEDGTFLALDPTRYPQGGLSASNTLRGCVVPLGPPPWAVMNVLVP